MKVFSFIISALILGAGFALFAYAFQAQEIFGPTDLPVEAGMFFLGIVAVAISYAIPFHLLGKAD